MENRPMQQKLPNDPLSLIMGILSIPFCCCYGLGIVFGIIGLITAGKAEKEYLANPELYLESSYKNTKTAKIISIIGIALGVISLIITIFGLVTGNSSQWEEMLRDMQ